MRPIPKDRASQIASHITEFKLDSLQTFLERHRRGDTSTDEFLFELDQLWFEAEDEILKQEPAESWEYSPCKAV